MNEIQAIRANHHRKLRDEIRRNQQATDQLLQELPYCDQCGHRVLRRAPCEHLKSTPADRLRKDLRNA